MKLYENFKELYFEIPDYEYDNIVENVSSFCEEFNDKEIDYVKSFFLKINPEFKTSYLQVYCDPNLVDSNLLHINFIDKTNWGSKYFWSGALNITKSNFDNNFKFCTKFECIALALSFNSFVGNNINDDLPINIDLYKLKDDYYLCALYFHRKGFINYKCDTLEGLKKCLDKFSN